MCSSDLGRTEGDDFWGWRDAMLALGAAAQSALERVGMGVDEAWQRECFGHPRILPSWRHVLFQPR